jgi:hypothetical protein
MLDRKQLMGLRHWREKPIIKACDARCSIRLFFASFYLFGAFGFETAPLLAQGIDRGHTSFCSDFLRSRYESWTVSYGQFQPREVGTELEQGDARRAIAFLRQSIKVLSRPAASQGVQYDLAVNLIAGPRPLALDLMTTAALKDPSLQNETKVLLDELTAMTRQLDVPYRFWQSALLFKLGQQYQLLGETETATTLFAEAEQRVEELQLPFAEGGATDPFGGPVMVPGLPPSPERQVSRQEFQLRLLLDFAEAYETMGDQRSALRLTEKSLNLLQLLFASIPASDHYEFSRALIQIALLKAKLGQLDVINFTQETSTQNDFYDAMSLSALSKGQLETALRWRRRQSAPDSFHSIPLAIALTNAGRVQEGVALFRDAVGPVLGNAETIESGLPSWLIFDYATGTRVEFALKILPDIKDPWVKLQVTLELATIAQKQGKPKLSDSLFQQAMAQLDRLDRQKVEFSPPESMIFMAIKAKQSALALKLLQRSPVGFSDRDASLIEALKLGEWDVATQVLQTIHPNFRYFSLEKAVVEYTRQGQWQMAVTLTKTRSIHQQMSLLGLIVTELYRQGDSQTAEIVTTQAQQLIQQASTPTQRYERAYEFLSQLSSDVPVDRYRALVLPWISPMDNQDSGVAQTQFLQGLSWQAASIDLETALALNQHIPNPNTRQQALLEMLPEFQPETQSEAIDQVLASISDPMLKTQGLLEIAQILFQENYPEAAHQRLLQAHRLVQMRSTPLGDRDDLFAKMALLAMDLNVPAVAQKALALTHDPSARNTLQRQIECFSPLKPVKIAS